MERRTTVFLITFGTLIILLIALFFIFINRIDDRRSIDEVLEEATASGRPLTKQEIERTERLIEKTSAPALSKSEERRVIKGLGDRFSDKFNASTQ